MNPGTRHSLLSPAFSLENELPGASVNICDAISLDNNLHCLFTIAIASDLLSDQMLLAEISIWVWSELKPSLVNNC